MRDYGKVHTSFWTSTTIRELSEDGRALAMYLLTSPHGTIAGVFRLPDGYASEDLQWSSERVCKGFAELFDKGFATRCEQTKWVWVTKHFEWNPPENPNQRKSVSKVVAQIPDGCGWKLDFMRVCAEFAGAEAKKKQNPFETLSRPFRNQEQDKEEANASLSPAELDDDPTPAEDLDDEGNRLPACPHRELIELFGKRLPQLAQPKPELWNGKNADAMRARWRWVLTAKKPSGQRYATNREEALNFFDRFFGYVATCPHLVGQNSRGWEATLAWLVTAGNFTKVMEGNYAPRAEEAAA